MGQWLNDLLGNPTVIVTILGLLIIAFAKSIINIFKLGVAYKAEFATKEEQKIYEEEMKKDMRNYAKQIQETVMMACLRIIEKELVDVKNVKEIESNMIKLQAKMEAEIKVTMEKYDEIQNVADSIHQINNRVTKLEYSQQNTMSSTTRRSEK